MNETPVWAQLAAALALSTLLAFSMIGCEQVINRIGATQQFR